MEILQVVCLGLVVTVLALIIRTQKPEIALFLGLVFGIIIFWIILDKLAEILTVFRQLAAGAQIDELYLASLIKILGIAYIAEFGAQICRDAGEGAIAGKIELAGKVLILWLALPILVGILEAVTRLLP